MSFAFRIAGRAFHINFGWRVKSETETHLNDAILGENVFPVKKSFSVFVSKGVTSFRRKFLQNNRENKRLV